MPVLSRLNRIVEVIVENVLAVLLLGITLLLSYNVITRYGFSHSFFWAEEMTNYIIIWMTLLGSGICVRRGLHMSVDIIFLHVIGFLRTFLLLFGIMVSLLFVAMVAVLGYQQVQNVIKYAQLTPALRIPMYIPYLALPIGGLLMVLEYIELFFSKLKGTK
ncbi:MAG: TRAP transporter small permease [Bacillota bacterium]